MSTKSWTELAEEELLNELEKAVDILEIANYCCGVPPIVLRWDPKPGNSMEALLQTCVPASFGLGGKDVLGETYRKAGKLDRSQFSIDFHPHDYGILDVVAQTLQQNVFQPDILWNRSNHRGVLAELYKLNIYSGPSGKFKAHVDTPRGTRQFGSLVVCLPCSYQGGQLRVTHRGSNTFFFDWGNKSDSIQWAAFYSDCEHEIPEVTSGHRVTLTYNLYISQQIGIPLQKNLVVDSPLSPLYEVARNVLDQPDFMRRVIVDVLLGGVIGFYCNHLYAHTQEDTDDVMPYALKGIDMTIFNTFQSLGLVVKAYPVLRLDHCRNIVDGGESESESEDENKYRSENESDDGNKGRSEVESDDGKEGKDRVYITRAGTQFHEVVESKLNEQHTNDLGWLGLMVGEVAVLLHYAIAYGNESSVMCFYSDAAILIEVPAYDERMAKSLA
ncbi:uncharacterized protein Bfra_008936 [Botrytis fragariae]|uniref:Fe2OG dioxygenase domain-containing protein n=1 Tax=Botrytis fragariae TaxID=1964551 RepID=A0A8H6AR86_9HELO|nr:uncharacterized protein Bfra_008936 [Botrytis fragariae]KAF5871910.1 hypothetical protein Bfra_008936 [Botrytis fragariae]